MPLILVVLLLVLFAPSALAADWVAPELAFAESIFGKPPCGQAYVQRAPLPPDYAARAWKSTCLIEIHNDFAFTSKAQRCHLLLHEFVHLHGIDHSPSPRNLMYARLTNYHYWRCRKRWRTHVRKGLPMKISRHWTLD